VRGYVVRPAKASGKLPAVLVIHENRGLNPYIEDVARRVAKAGFMALAPDGLTSVGGYPGNDAESKAPQKQSTG
jgi:carboxymethylenebutenolidase